MPHFIKSLKNFEEPKLAFLSQKLISQRIKEAIEEEICQLSSNRKQCDAAVRTVSLVPVQPWFQENSDIISKMALGRG